MYDSALPWNAAHQVSLSLTFSQSLLKFMSIESVMLSNHLIHCHPFAFIFSQHQGLCQWVGCSHYVVKILELLETYDAINSDIYVIANVPPNRPVQSAVKSKGHMQIFSMNLGNLDIVEILLPLWAHDVWNESESQSIKAIY